MSFEGYYQKLCKNGHHSTVDAYFDYGDFDGEWKCAVCGEGEAWSHLVDTTNGSFDTNPDTGEEERIDGFVELEEVVQAQTCTCCKCGNKHIVAPPTYKIPKTT